MAHTLIVAIQVATVWGGVVLTIASTALYRSTADVVWPFTTLTYLWLLLSHFGRWKSIVTTTAVSRVSHVQR